jgi:hypothetical protein
MKYVLGERLTLPSGSDHKTMSPIFRESDGVLIAFLGMENGWGKAWEFYPIRQRGSAHNLGYGNFGPDTNAGVAFYKTGLKREAVVEAFEDIYNDNLDKFKDANERVTIDKATKAATEQFFEDSINNMKSLRSSAVRRINAFKSLLSRDGEEGSDVILTGDEVDAVKEAILAFEAEVKTLDGSIAFAKKKQKEE